MPSTGTRTVSETSTALAGSASGLCHVWDDEEGEGDNGKGLRVLENRREAGEDLKKTPLQRSVHCYQPMYFLHRPAFLFGWGLFFPPLSSKNLSFLPFSPGRTLRYGDLWETGNGGSAGKTGYVVRSVVDEDLNNSLECPSLLPTVLFPSPLITPIKPTFSASFLSSTHQRSGTEKTETHLLPAPDSTIHPMLRARAITTGVWIYWIEQEHLSGSVPFLDTIRFPILVATLWVHAHTLPLPPCPPTPMP